MSKPLIEGIDFYLNEKGLMVLTEKFHLDKGYCCGNGCLHCPYEYSGVAEPYRTQLIEARKKLQGKRNKEKTFK